MTEFAMSSQNQKSAKKPRAPDLVGAQIALRRAAERVRRRAAETGSAVVVVNFEDMDILDGGAI